MIPLKAIDETSSFLKKWSHTEVCKFVDKIQDNLVKKDNCYYQKLMIIGFGGVKLRIKIHLSIRIQVLKTNLFEILTSKKRGLIFQIVEF